MKMPWHDKTGLAKTTAFLVTCLLVASGLCGVNFIAVILYIPLGGPGPQPGQPTPSQWPANILATTGGLELTAIALSLTGLCIVAVAAIFRAIRRHFSPSSNEEIDG